MTVRKDRIGRQSSRVRVELVEVFRDISSCMSSPFCPFGRIILSFFHTKISNSQARRWRRNREYCVYKCERIRRPKIVVVAKMFLSKIHTHEKKQDAKMLLAAE
jgi:hypothetical protein